MKKKYCVICHSPLSGQKQKYCSNKCKQKDHYHRVKKQTNTYHSQTMRALVRKVELVEMLGSRCSCCGYNKNLAALHFHHIDANTKAFKLGMRILSNRKMSDILSEVRKCKLLCANCHAEEHNPELSFSNVKKIIAGASYGKR